MVLIKYVCECCDKLVEEIMLSEEIVYELSEDDSTSSLTGLSPDAIIKLETQGCLNLDIICPECLSELALDQGATLSVKTKTQFIN